MSADGEVRVKVTAGTAEFEKALSNAKKEAERFDKEATEAAAAALKLDKSSTAAAKSAAKLAAEAAAAAKGTAALRKGEEAAAKEAARLSKDATAAAAAAKKLEKNTRDSSKSAGDLKREAAEAAMQVSRLRTAAKEAAKEAQALRKSSEDSAKGTAKLSKSAAEAAKRAQDLKNKALAASKASKELGRRSARAAKDVKKMQTAAAKAASKTNKFRGAMKQAGDAATLITGPLGGVASRLSTVGRITTLAGAAMLALAVAIGAVTIGLSKAVSEAEKFERSGLRIEAVLKATGNASGFTSKEIRRLSEEIARATLANTAGVEAAAAKLLTFRSIQGDVFTEALNLSQDLAELGFGSIESGAVQLGKALEDPITGISALARVGVSFSAVQKDQIKRFVEANQLAKAQGLILGVLNKQVGGVGVKAAQGLTGAYDTLGQEVSELLQNIGNAGPIQAMTSAMTGLGNSIRALNDALFAAPADKIQELLAERAEAMDIADIGIPGISKVAALRVKAINQEIRALQDKRVEEQKSASSARAAAEASRAAAIKEAEIAKVLEKQAAERERLTKLRENTVRSIKEEIAVLSAVSAMQTDASVSARDLAEMKERVTVLTRLGLDATSKEGEAVSALIKERTRLTAVLAQERAEREQAAATDARLQSIEAEIAATNILSAAIGGSTEEVREARVASKAYRIEQELIASVLQKQGELTAAQADAIREQSQAIAESSVRLEEAQAAQNKLLAAEQEANAKRVEFQETLASGLTDIVTGAASAEEALKNMVLQISQAIIQAQILNAIQGASGGSGGTSGVIGFISGAVSSASTSTSGSSTTTASRLHRGGTVGQAGQAVSVPASNFISAPRFHDGLKPDEFPAILQRGEEVTPKDQVGARRGGDRPIVFNVNTPDADSFRKSQRQISRKFRQATAAT